MLDILDRAAKGERINDIACLCDMAIHNAWPKLRTLCHVLSLTLVCSWAVLAFADGQVLLSPGPGYRIDFSTASERYLMAFPAVRRQGLSPVDRWFQVAPGGAVVAIWSASTGFVVLRSGGGELLHRPGMVTAFRFSPEGDRLAFASSAGIEIIRIGQNESKVIHFPSRVDALLWADKGLVVRSKGILYLVALDGTRRKISPTPVNMPFVAARDTLVYFAPGSLVVVDLDHPEKGSARKLADHEPVINADISPDAQSILFATSHRVYLYKRGEPVRVISEANGIESLFFSPGGDAYLWCTAMGKGAVTEGDRTTPLPPETRSARFRQTAKTSVVVTGERGVMTWDPSSRVSTVVGGISSEDGANLAGDLLGSDAAISLYYKFSGAEQENRSISPPRL
jgi:hypothetical protein